MGWEIGMAVAGGIASVVLAFLAAGKVFRWQVGMAFAVLSIVVLAGTVAAVQSSIPSAYSSVRTIAGSVYSLLVWLTVAAGALFFLVLLIETFITLRAVAVRKDKDLDVEEGIQ